MAFWNAFDDPRSAGPMEVFNQDLLYVCGCGLSFPYQALGCYNYRNPTTFVALERWRNTTGPVVRAWLIVPKPSRAKNPSKSIQFWENCFSNLTHSMKKCDSGMAATITVVRERPITAWHSVQVARWKIQIVLNPTWIQKFKFKRI